jgi:DtxR family Mn-dependent transcriptional regulator
LKAIYEIRQETGARLVGTAALADKLGVSRASVTGMLKKLAVSPERLIVYTRYRGVRLTPKGEKAALEVVRHHRLLEAYLTTALGYSWDEVHSEADHLEHVISEAFEERIAAFLGHPESDPHGAPIPLRDGSLPSRREIRLSQLDIGQEAAISRVSDRDPEMLRYLDQLGLRPPQRLRVLERGPFDGPIHIQSPTSSSVIALSRRVTDDVYVVLEPVEGGVDKHAA